jgi:hypothetical protein
MTEYSMTIIANSSMTVAKTADEFNEAVEKLIENERHITRIEVRGHLAPRVDYSRLTELFRRTAFVTVGDSECDGLTVALLFNALEDPDCKIIDVRIPRDADKCGESAIKRMFALNKSLQVVTVSNATVASWVSTSTTVRRISIHRTDNGARVDWLPILQMPSLRSIYCDPFDLPPMKQVYDTWGRFRVIDVQPGRVWVARYE